MKKAAVLFVVLWMVFGLFANETSQARLLPTEIAEQFGKLYVCQRGRVCRLGNTCNPQHRQEELTLLFFEGQNLLLFPYVENDSVIWLSASSYFPSAMPDDERNFIKNVQRYMCELAEEKEYDELTKVISQVKNYQQKNGNDSLPSAFAEALDNSYASCWKDRISMGIICVGLILMGYFLIRKKTTPQKTYRIFSFVAFLYLSLLLAVRWIVGRHIPLASGHEVMLFFSWCLFLFNLIGINEQGIMLPSSLMGGLIIWIASCFFDPTITALPIALDSPLLGFHVAISIFAYAIFTLMAINGIHGLVVLKKNKENQKAIEIQNINQHLLKPGTICLAMGILMGSIWAKTAWGSFWSWDPKETWSLITLIIYSLGYLPIFKSEKAYHIFSVVGFLFVLFTYLGVNYLLGGRHGYV